jgi:hypothetical protein
MLIVSLAIATLTACGGGGSQPPATTSAPAPMPTAPPPPVSNYTGAPVTGGGSIEGTVTYAGTEKDTTITVTKDDATCALHGKEHPAETLVVKDGKLANAIVWIDGITAGKPFTPGTVTIDNMNCTFHPHVLVGWLGGKIAAHNSDPILHNTNMSFVEGNKPIGNVALPTQGQTIEKDLKKTGMVAIKCDAHEWMSAHMLVAEHPYATVTDENGKFSFTDVPPGTYTVKFWHERLGDKSAQVTVAAGAAAMADQAY